KYAAHFCIDSFVRSFRCSHDMELRVFLLFVTCCVTCILCRNAVSGSTLTEVFPSNNNAYEPGVRISEIGNTRTERSIETKTRPYKITAKDYSPKPETLFVSLPRERRERISDCRENLLMKKRIFNDFNKTKCSRYCMQQLGISKGFEDIKLILSFLPNENGDDYFSIENSSNFKILKHLSTDNKSSTIFDSCQIYLNLNCDIVNVERNLVIKTDEFYSNAKFNSRNIEIFKNCFLNIPEFSQKKLEHKINLSGYTKTNFQTDSNVTGIAINILGNLTRKMIQRPEIVISLASIYNTKGVAVGARNLPDRLCVKLMGMENSKYNMDVIAYYGANKENNTRDDIININSINVMHYNWNLFLDEILDKIHKKHITRAKTSSVIERKFERSAEIMDPRRNNDEITDNFSDISLSPHTHIHKRESIAVIDKNNINHFVLRNNSLISYGEFKILSNFSNIEEQQQKIQARSSEVASLNEERGIDAKMISSDEIISMQMDSDQSQKLSTQINEDPFERRKLLLDVNVNSKLIASPGTTHRVIFDATNNCVLPVRYTIRARSSPFRIYNIQPPIYMWLYPGQTDQVAVDILVPAGTQETVNTLTLSIVGTEILEKTVQVFVHNELSREKIDNVKPTIEYWFNSNCLKRVIAVPNGLYPRTKYISGTKERVTFYYLSTCCTPTATITAIDISENQYTRSIDVTAWDNLSQGEIAAVVLGALLLLLLIVCVIIAIVYCVRKRNSHDLPYTQRYGSRSQPARAERTSF
ncbi:hypothetical protein ALC56_12477, partial [Trachymyrmex septentrionalis]